VQLAGLERQQMHANAVRDELEGVVAGAVHDAPLAACKIRAAALQECSGYEAAAAVTGNCTLMVAAATSHGRVVRPD
jgi:hypothetical protein